MFCNAEYDVSTRNAASLAEQLFVCDIQDGLWNIAEPPDCSRTTPPHPLPHMPSIATFQHSCTVCSGSRRPTGYQMELEVNYFVGDCCDPLVQSELGEQFVTQLNSNEHFGEACELHQGDCRCS